MTDKEAMKLALFALDIVKMHYTQSRHVNEAITALKERLSDPMRDVQRLGQEIEQEPICPECKAKVLYECVACSSNNYPPPQRTWVDLSDEDIEECFTITPDLYLKRHIAQRILDKFKEKNNG
jgi:hypothetical protein